jgi:hypothetical protein
VLHSDISPKCCTRCDIIDDTIGFLSDQFCCDVIADTMLYLLEWSICASFPSWAFVLEFVSHTIWKWLPYECYVSANGTLRLWLHTIRLAYAWKATIFVFRRINDIRLPCHNIECLYRTRLWLREFNVVFFLIYLEFWCWIHRSGVKHIYFWLSFWFEYWCWSQKTTHFVGKRVVISICKDDLREFPCCAWYDKELPLATWACPRWFDCVRHLNYWIFG